MAGVLLFFMAIFFAFLVFSIVTFWKLFTKAGKPGWAGLVPFYNIIVFLEITGRPLWWFVLLLIPFVNLVIAVVVTLDMAKVFGKDTGFGLGLLFLGFIFYPILAFGEARYIGPVASK